MYELAKDTSQLVVFAVDVGLVQQSWPQLLWLLEQTERYKTILGLVYTLSVLIWKSQFFHREIKYREITSPAKVLYREN